jgi:hypothetical protein
MTPILQKQTKGTKNGVSANRILPMRRKGDKDKVTIASKLRQETTMTHQWIAQRLGMGSWACLSNLLSARRAKP